MQLEAIDTIRITSAGGRIEPGQRFDVNDHEGAELVRRGLARVPSAEGAKAEAAPKNKARRAPKNKEAQ